MNANELLQQNIYTKYCELIKLIYFSGDAVPDRLINDALQRGIDAGADAQQIDALRQLQVEALI